MNSTRTNPVHWRLDTLLSFEHDELHELARIAAGTLTSYRLVLGRCLLALHHSKGYKKYGCSSAIHYASAVLGLHPQEARACRRVANLLSKLPELTLAAESGKIAWSKLREIVRKASPETEELWLKLAASHSYKEIEILVRRTPKGSVPGELDTEDSVCSELRCQLSDEVFAMLNQARRAFSLEKGEAVSNAEVLEWALTSYISSQPVGSETLEKVRAESDKDLMAERARELPLVLEAREVAESLGLLENANSDLDEVDQLETAETPESFQEGDSEIDIAMMQALGAAPMEKQSSIGPHVTGTPFHRRVQCSVRAKTEAQSWENKRLRFNPQSRHTTRAQKTEILRRDAWCCQTPGCPHKVWLHLHHLKPYAQGGQTERDNLLCLCSGCHRNHHQGELRISASPEGKLQFTDKQGHPLDQQRDLELAGWLDFWLGWRGKQTDSRTMRTHNGKWGQMAG